MPDHWSVGDWIDLGGNFSLFEGVAGYVLIMFVFAFMDQVWSILMERVFWGISSSLMWISVSAMTADLAGENMEGVFFGRIAQSTNRGGIVGTFLGFFIDKHSNQRKWTGDSTWKLDITLCYLWSDQSDCIVHGCTTLARDSTDFFSGGIPTNLMISNKDLAFIGHWKRCCNDIANPDHFFNEKTKSRYKKTALYLSAISPSLGVVSSSTG